jgi:hypothetical protein
MDMPIQFVDHTISISVAEPNSERYATYMKDFQGPPPGPKPSMEPGIALREQKYLEVYQLMIKRIKAHNNHAKHDWFCPDCGGVLKKGLNPMCPVCTSRDVQQKGTYVHYD